MSREATSTFMPVTILVELEFGDAGVFLGEKSGEPEKKNLGARREATANSNHI